MGYGVLHNQATVRLSPEYFTIAHPPLVASDSLTLLALAWGLMATWWVGFPFGFLLAGAAQNGRLPPVSAKALLPALLLLAGVMAGAAVVSGLLAATGSLGLEVPHGLRDEMTPAEETRFVAVWAAHRASYLVGIVGSLLLAGHTYRSRRSAVPS